MKQKHTDHYKLNEQLSLICRLQLGNQKSNSVRHLYKHRKACL